jgi:ubiquinone/menaquinone biosynthesis C-methylase UbiE
LQQTDATQQWDKNARAWRDQFGGNDPNRKYLLDDVVLESIGEVEDRNVLDAGCGEGYMSRKLARLGAKVIGVDLSAEMLAFAKEDEMNKPLGINYYRADIADMPFLHDDSFDLVLTNVVIGDCQHYRRAFGQFARVLRRRGVYIFVDTHPCFATPECGWERDYEGNKLHFKVDNYFDGGSTKLVRWTNDVLEPTVAYYRTLSAYYNALVESGFKVCRIMEPRPKKEAIEKWPVVSDQLRIPFFIVMVCELS